MSITKFDVGDTIAWSSQAGGMAKTKKGRILAVIAGNEPLDDVMRRRLGLVVKPSHVKAQGISLNLRYLIEVYPSSKRRAPGRGMSQPDPVYYAPLVAVIDGTSASAGIRR